MNLAVYKSGTDCDEEFLFELLDQSRVFVKILFCDNCEKMHEFILETSISSEISIINEENLANE